ncbi:MAG: chemotaxis protein CheA, partial [Gemmatimonadota bacterium]
TVTLRAARAFVILQRAAQIGQVFDHAPPLEEIRAGRIEFELAFKIRTAQEASDVESHLAASGEVERADVAPPAEVGVAADEPAADAERVPTARSGGVRVRVDIRRLDALMDLVGELVLVREELREWSQRHRSPGFEDLVDRATRLVGDLQREVLQSRMVPVWQVFDRFPRVVRDTARGLGKEVELIVEGKEIELDRSMLDEIGDPLIHLLRNAVDHGVEAPEERVRAGKSRAGRIRLGARRERDTVVLEISDDGRGIRRAALVAKGQELGLLPKDAPASLDDQEMWRLMAHSGLTTAGAVTGVSGRGVGLNVVEDRIRGLGGTVSLESREGVGTIFRLELPLTLAIVRALVVRSHGARYAIPITHARETARSDESAVERADGREWLRWRDELVPFTRLGHVLGGDGAAPGPFPVVALEVGGRRLALAVDELVGEQEIVVKAFHPPQGTLSIFSGATVMPDGRPVLIVDVASLA